MNLDFRTIQWMGLRGGETPRWQSASGVVVVAFCALGLLLPTPSVSAVTYEPVPAFCDGNIVLHDYLRPLRRMSKLHSPPASGRVRFGPAAIGFKTYAPLVVGDGTVGYNLYLRQSFGGVRLNWDALVTLVRVDWRGRPLRVVERKRQRLGRVTRRHSAGLRLQVGGQPAPYRLTVVFRNEAGHRLGVYRFYTRVVVPTKKGPPRVSVGRKAPELI